MVIWHQNTVSYVCYTLGNGHVAEWRIYTYLSANGNIDELGLEALHKLGLLVIEELPQS